jgi:hybrid cluster-associated redox disulfide protein
MSYAIDPDEMVEVSIERHPRLASILRRHGMHCAGCAIAPFETLTEACAIYGVPVSDVIEELGRPASARPRARGRRA